VTLNAAALRLMADKGLSASDIAEIAEAMSVVKDRTAAERQQRRRDKVKAEKIDRDASRVTSRRDAPLLPPNDIYSNPPTTPEPLETSSEVSAPSEISNEKGGEPPLTAEEVLEAYNDTAGKVGLSKAKMTPERRRKLNSRLRVTTIQDWTEAISALSRSPFLRGENDRGWRADFDFMLQPKSFQRLIEGGYDRATH